MNSCSWVIDLLFFDICKLIIWLEYWLTAKIRFRFFFYDCYKWCFVDLFFSELELNTVFLYNVWFRWCRYNVNMPACSRVARDTNSYAILSIVATHNGCCACTIKYFVYCVFVMYFVICVHYRFHTYHIFSRGQDVVILQLVEAFGYYIVYRFI